MSKILKPEQKMYLILCLASGMRDECAGKDELKADYQIASRIYANAFASLIRYGIPPVSEVRDGVAFLTMELEGCAYGCPARTVKNIMKTEFASVEEKLPEIVPLIREEEYRLAAESKNGKRRRKEASGDAVREALKPAPAIVDIKPVEQGSVAGLPQEPAPVNTDRDTPADTAAEPSVPFQDPAPEPPETMEKQEMGKARGTAAAHMFRKKQSQAGEPVAPPAPDIQEAEPPLQAAGKAAAAVPNAAPKNPLGRFSRFLPKGRKQEILNAVPAVQSQQEEAVSVPDVIPQAGEEIHGERICHTHYVMLRKTYGTQVTGPYTIQVWPTEVIGMHPERTPSAIFVRAQAPNGTVVCRVNEGHAKYIVLEIDNKQFNVFGFWEAGGFISEVTAINKTASIYTISEEVEQECPEPVSDAFLDQFRSREPHRPEFFVVPVGNVIQGEEPVPIAAFIRVKDKNYPVSSKGKGNTLRFTYENQLSEISGWWENGKFTFAIRAVEQE